MSSDSAATWLCARSPLTREAEAVGAAVGVGEAMAVGVADAVGVGVGDAVTLGVGDRTTVDVGLGEAVGVGELGAGSPELSQAARRRAKARSRTRSGRGRDNRLRRVNGPG
jgi:hypothetical protein